MKKAGFIVLLAALLLATILPAVAEVLPNDGYANDIQVYAMSNEETAIVSVANGEYDIFLFSRPSGAYKDLDPSILDNLELIRSASVYAELTLNPVHDEGDLPIITVGDKVYLNPFAIREVRYAVNWLISREHIVQNIYQGSGAVQYGAFNTFYPFNEKMKDLYNALGLTPEGNEELAIQMIDDAMNKAAQKLAEAGYTLEKKDGKWYFNGEPVVIKGISRVEDERKDVGTYFASVLEKAGFTVQNNIWDRKKAIQAVYLTDPKNYEWNYYTGGWVAEAAEAWPETELPQFYSSWYWGLPGIVGWQHTPTVTVKDLIDTIGGADKIQLNYYKGDKLNEILDFTVDDITMLLVNGKLEKDNKTYTLENVDQYWDLQKLGLGLGIMDSVRVFTISQTEYFPVNKDRVNVNAMMVDPVSGLYTRNALLTAQTSDRILKVIEYSSTGALFMSAFNPIGSDDIYAMLIWRLITSPALWLDQNGVYQPVKLEYKVEKGEFQVPADAVVYNSTTDQWEPAKGGTAKVRVTYKVLDWGKWHNGEPVTPADLKYYIAFMKEWSTQDGENDTYYDESLEANAEVFNNIEGIVFTDDGYVVYGNYAHVVADDLTASYYAFFPDLPWELWYVMGEMVANGYADQKWSFSEASEGVNQIDMLLKDHVDQIKSALEEMKGKIPSALQGVVSADEAAKRYDADIKFIDTYGHAVISNGPYFIAKYDPESLYIELKSMNPKPVETPTPVSTPTEQPAKTETPATTPTKEEKSTPGFEAVFALAGLLAVAYVARRRAR
ncbi:ABC transporter substrate-binding protein [Geoglobus acetivorans]